MGCKVSPQQIYIATTSTGKYVLVIDGVRSAASFATAAEAVKDRDRLLALYSDKARR
jgi:hypothetical protein